MTWLDYFDKRLLEHNLYVTHKDTQGQIPQGVQVTELEELVEWEGDTLKSTMHMARTQREGLALTVRMDEVIFGNKRLLGSHGAYLKNVFSFVFEEGVKTNMAIYQIFGEKAYPIYVTEFSSDPEDWFSNLLSSVYPIAEGCEPVTGKHAPVTATILVDHAVDAYAKLAKDNF